MAIRTQKWGITKGKRGWQKWMHGKTVWVASFAEAPTAGDADRIFAQRTALPDNDPKKIRLDAPPPRFSGRPEQVPVADLSDAYLHRKRKLVDQGLLSELYAGPKGELEGVMNLFIETIGSRTRFCDLTPQHFTDFHDVLHERFEVHTRAKFIKLVKSLFRFAGPPPHGTGLVPTIPLYGSGFKVPSRKEFRLARKRSRELHGVRKYEPAEIAQQLAGKPVEYARLRKGKKETVKAWRRPSKAMKAMILLGLNGGFGNTDCAELPLSIALPAMEDGWMDYARGKTGVDRLFWLWPETRTAMQEYYRSRPEPRQRSHANRFFLTQLGQPWIMGRKNSIAMRYARLLDALGQKRRGFRTLRRTARTVAAETGQELAIDLIMGHADDAEDMAKVYTVEVSREIIKTVCLHVRSRLLSYQPMLFSPAAA